MAPILQQATYGLLAAAGNLLGGWLVVRARPDRHARLKYLVALGAGFMLAAVLVEVIPVMLDSGRANAAMGMTWLLAGYLLIQLVEHTVAPHFHFGEETHKEILEEGAATTAVIALFVHAFFDGVTIASGLLTERRLGLLLFVAVILHKIPEGFTAASIMLASGHTPGAALRAAGLIGLATVAGALSISVISVPAQAALALSAGVTLYVAASDLIPEVNREGGARASLMVFAGVALFYLTHLLLHAAIE
ncbi:MAG: ZIP family metal transporter [Blastocatellia bacterium]